MRPLTEMQVFLLILMRNGPSGVCYIAGHTVLPDVVEYDKGVWLLRDPRKGEDLRSVLRKLERLTSAGLCTARGDSFFTITEEGRGALTKITDARQSRAQAAIDVMRARYVERQAKWNAEQGQ